MKRCVTTNQSNLLPFEGEVFYFSNFFSKKQSDDYFEKLQIETQWKQEPIVLFGKKIMQPRLTSWYGDKNQIYGYSGIKMTPNLWTPTLLEIKKEVETLSSSSFNSALLNQYRNGQDSMGWHRDNEKELGPEPIIASVSFGETRNFFFRHYKTKDVKICVTLSHGDVLLMRGTTQKYWQHAVFKSSNTLKPRINITFRHILEGL